MLDVLPEQSTKCVKYFRKLYENANKWQNKVYIIKALIWMHQTWACVNMIKRNRQYELLVHEGALCACQMEGGRSVGGRRHREGGRPGRVGASAGRTGQPEQVGAGVHFRLNHIKSRAGPDLFYRADYRISGPTLITSHQKVVHVQQKDRGTLSF